MCNLLWAIAGQIDLARRQMPQDHPALRHLDTMERALAQGNELLESLSTTARKHEPCPMKPVELRGLIGKLLDLIRGLMGPEIEVVDLASAGAPIWVEGDPVEIRRALINLATNSRVAMPAGGRWEIALRVFQRRSGLLSSTGLVEITVEDTGCGMDEAVRSRLFDRYFTTRTGRGGKGLGAFLVADIAARHNGCVEVESEPEAGTRITLTLPQLTVESHAVDCGDHRLAAQAASAGVLVVGSDEQSRSKLGFALGQSGYQVLEAADEVAVEAFVNQSAGPVRTAVLAMNGHRDRDLVLYRRLRTIASLQSVFVVASKRDQQPADLDPADRWFATPLRVDELISAVGRCLESPAQQGR
jgi:CheY-like chemotaxis protein/anti-sigma regulatory factor (Ser/Thr protein kinase)